VKIQYSAYSFHHIAKNNPLAHPCSTLLLESESTTLVIMDSEPNLIETTKDLNAALKTLLDSDFVAIDTEFMRETTYYPKLCLVQLSANKKTICVDPLAPNIDLSALFDLMQNPKIVKVFHAGRQDLEIFVHLTGQVPSPIYDTQIAAMVCGLGDQVGYDRLVQHYTRQTLDKSSRYTNWLERPLTNRQVKYAADDVIFLAEIYPLMLAQLKQTDRTDWVENELASLSELSLYLPNPETIWKRLKFRGGKPSMINRLAKLGKWRETEAQKRNVPRGRLLRDDTLIDLAGSNPKTAPEFRKIRGFPGGETGKLVKPVLDVLQEAAHTPEAEYPQFDRQSKREKAPQALVDLLRVLLKHVTEEREVAPRLIASVDDLERLALDDQADIPALSGWRYEIFGKIALELKQGRLALSVTNGKTKVMPIST
jgi:ribonuclease D